MCVCVSKNITIHFLLDCICNQIFRPRTTISIRHRTTYTHGRSVRKYTWLPLNLSIPGTRLVRCTITTTSCMCVLIIKSCVCKKKSLAVRPWWNYTHADRVAAASRWRGHFDLWSFLSWHPPRAPTPSARSSGGHPPHVATTVAGMLIVHFQKKRRYGNCAPLYKKIRYTSSWYGVISRVYIHNARVIYVVFICVNGRRVHRVILFYCTAEEGVEKINPPHV